MLTVKQVFEFARDGAFETYKFATKCENFDAAHALAQIIKEIQNVIDNLDKKKTISPARIRALKPLCSLL